MPELYRLVPRGACQQPVRQRQLEDAGEGGGGGETEVRTTDEKLRRKEQRWSMCVCGWVMVCVCVWMGDGVCV